MEIRWNPFGFQLHRLSGFVFLILFSIIHKSWSLNLEGLALLEFRARVDTDPHGAFTNWNPNDSNPCLWSGVYCMGGQVKMLDLKDLSLEGILAPELGNLSHLKSLVLSKNRFLGEIPKEFGRLTRLELLDLRNNNLSGAIPAEIGGMVSLKRLLLCNNTFQGSVPHELEKLLLLSELDFDEKYTSAVATGADRLDRQFGRWFKFKKGSSWCGHGEKLCDNPPSSDEPQIIQNMEHMVSFVRRRLLQESINLLAEPASDAPSEEITTVPTTRSSGSFPAIPNGKKLFSPPSSKSFPADSPSHQFPSISNPIGQSAPPPAKSIGKPNEGTWKYVIVLPAMAFLLCLSAALLLTCRNRGVTTIGPWKTGISGQLQKAFVTGVPKLNRTELEIACEDFSNIILTLGNCTVFKGTLSSGVEIAVASTGIASFKDWSEGLEMAFRKKIGTLSRVNHKNFVNLIGYCEDDKPFLRMMVFEYAPNGILSEHLHVEEVEHLDWNARVRIIMGIAYCLQYMHHDLNPPVVHPDLVSSSIVLTDDYAAKIADVKSWTNDASKSKISSKDDSKHSELPLLADPETNVYSFGVMLLEIISGRHPYSKEHGSLVDWAAEYLNNREKTTSMVDPSLKGFKNAELYIICEVIQECIHEDPRQRPTMQEVTSKLREVIAISPDAAAPKLSPLWWAELEILSVEA